MNPRAVVLVIVLLLSACGSGGGGSSNPPSTSVTFSGIVYDGPVANATVQLKTVDNEILASTVTNNAGRFTVSADIANSIASDVLLIESSGGVYPEDTNGNIVTIAASRSLMAGIVTDSVANRSITVSALTSIATANALYQIEQGVAPTTAFDTAYNYINSWVDFDTLYVEPVNLFDVTFNGSTSHRYGLIALGISRFVTDELTRQGLPLSVQAADDCVFCSIEFLQHAIHDMRSDGLLDGIGYGNRNTLVQLYYGAMFNPDPLTANTYRTKIPLAMLRGAALVGVPANEVLPYVDLLNTSVMSFFAGQPVEPIGSIGPVFSDISIDANAVLFGSETLSFSVADLLGLNRITVSLDNTLLFETSDSGVAIDIDTTLYSDGSHTLNLLAESIDGSTTTIPIPITISNNGIALTDVQPANAAVIRGTTQFHIIAQHPAGITAVDLYLDGSPRVLETSNNVFYFLNLDTTFYDDGLHSYRFVATNAVGGTAEVTGDFRINNNAPLVTWGVVNGIFIEDTYTITATVSDQTNVGNVSLFIDDDVVSTSNTLADVNYTFDTTAYADGNHDFRIVATDGENNTEDTTRTVTIDNTPPEIRINFPADDDRFDDEFTMSFNVEDVNGFADNEFQILIDDEHYGYVHNTALTRRINPQSYGTGLKELKLVATDASGKTSAASVFIYFD